jgi:hypothetical protein
MSDSFGPVQGMTVSYDAADVTQAKRVFDALAEGGIITQALQPNFFSEAYANVRRAVRHALDDRRPATAATLLSRRPQRGQRRKLPIRGEPVIDRALISAASATGLAAAAIWARLPRNSPPCSPCPCPVLRSA